MNKKSLAIIATIALLLLVGFGLFSFVDKQNDTDSQKQQESQYNADKKADAVDNSLDSKEEATGNNSSGSNSKYGNTTGNYSTPSDPENIQLTASNGPDNTVTLIAKLYGYSDGMCSVSARNNGKTLSQEAPIVFNREYSSCAGFSLPTSSLGAGTWQITLTVTSQGESVSKTINYEVGA